MDSINARQGIIGSNVQLKDLIFCKPATKSIYLLICFLQSVGRQKGSVF